MGSFLCLSLNLCPSFIPTQKSIFSSKAQYYQLVNIISRLTSIVTLSDIEFLPRSVFRLTSLVTEFLCECSRESLVYCRNIINADMLFPDRKTLNKYVYVARWLWHFKHTRRHLSVNEISDNSFPHQSLRNCSSLAYF